MQFQRGSTAAKKIAIVNFLFRAVQFGLMHIWPAVVIAGAASTLAPGDVGFIAILMSVATLFRPLVGLSLGRTAIRYAGLAENDAGVEGARSTLALALRLGLLSSIPGAVLIALALAACSAIYEFRLDARLLWLSCAFVYFFGLSELMDGIFRAIGKFRYLSFAFLVSRILGVSLILINIFREAHPDNFVISILIAELLCVIILLAKLIPLLFEKLHAPRTGGATALQLLRYSVPVIVNALSVYAYARAMVMIVGLYESGGNIGGFELAVQIANLPMAVTVVCATVLSPAVARLAARGTAGHGDAVELLSRGASISVWVNTVAAAYLLVVGPFAMAWLFPGLPAAPLVLVILAPLIAAKAYAQILLGEIAIVLGVAATGARLTLIFGVVTVAAGFAFVPAAGVEGAAAAMLLSHGVAVAVSVAVLQRKTGMRLRYRGWPSVLAAASAALPALVVVMMLRTNPAGAAVWGSIAFLGALAFTVLVLGRRFRSLNAPLMDGIRMIRESGGGAG